MFSLNSIRRLLVLASLFGLAPLSSAGAAAFNGVGLYNGADYGMSPGGTAAANTTALNNAITAAASTCGAVVIPAAYQVNSFTVPGCVFLVGYGTSTSILYQNNTTGAFITFNGTNAGLDGIGVITTVAASSGDTIHVNAGGIRLLNFSLYAAGTSGQHMHNGIHLDADNAALYYIDNFVISGAENAGIVSGDPSNSTSTTPPIGIISNGQIGSYGSGVGVLLYQNGGTTWSNIQELHGAHGFQTYAGAGQVIFAQYFVNCFADSNSSDAWSIGSNGGKVGDIHLSNVWGSTSSGGHGLSIQGAAAGQIDGVNIQGGAFVNNNKAGITLAQASNITINGADIFNNSQASSGGYPGVSVAAGTSGFTITNNTIGAGGISKLKGFPSQQSYGVVVNPGSSDGYIIEFNRGSGNLSTTFVSDGGTGVNKRVDNNIAY